VGKSTENQSICRPHGNPLPQRNPFAAHTECRRRNWRACLGVCQCALAHSHWHSTVLGGPALGLMSTAALAKCYKLKPLGGVTARRCSLFLRFQVRALVLRCATHCTYSVTSSTMLTLSRVHDEYLTVCTQSIVHKQPPLHVTHITSQMPTILKCKFIQQGTVSAWATRICTLVRHTAGHTPQPRVHSITTIPRPYGSSPTTCLPNTCACVVMDTGDHIASLHHSIRICELHQAKRTSGEHPPIRSLRSSQPFTASL
jgi:hypothetical protein